MKGRWERSGLKCRRNDCSRTRLPIDSSSGGRQSHDSRGGPAHRVGDVGHAMGGGEYGHVRHLGAHAVGGSTRRHRGAHNLKAHKGPLARHFIEARGATVIFLPPYSHDFNPIESVWALVKKEIKTFAPRTAGALRRVVRAARYAVRPEHCAQFSAHLGYVNSSAGWG